MQLWRFRPPTDFFTLRRLLRDTTLGAQPGDHFLVSFTDGSIQWCQFAVSHPVQVGALCQKVTGGFQLASVAGIPKRIGYITLRRFRISRKVFLEAIH